MRTRLAIIGFGQRARTYCSCLPYPPAAVVDPSQSARVYAASLCGILQGCCFESLDELAASGIELEGVIICSPDSFHFSQAKFCIEHGWHILMEKPVALRYSECLELSKLAREAGVMVEVCYELRMQPRFVQFRNLLQSRGPVCRITHHVDVGIDRMTHSFVRGIWGSSAKTGPIALTKLCHDVDFLLWSLPGVPVKWSSHGSLSTFVSANAPAGAAARCLDCSVNDCPYSAVDLYLRRREWIAGFVPIDGESSGSMIMRYLRESDFGRCVFHSDNDVNDRQTISFSYADGTEVEILMNVSSRMGGRHCRVEFRDGTTLDYDFSGPSGSEGPLHSGADKALLDDFIRQISSRKLSPAIPLDEALMSHRICLDE